MYERSRELYERTMDDIHSKLNVIKSAVENLSLLIEETELTDEEWRKLSGMVDRIAIKLDEI